MEMSNGEIISAVKEGKNTAFWKITMIFSTVL